MKYLGKYWGINLTKFAHALFAEKYKLKIEIKHLSKWKDRANSWIERLNIVKMSFSPNQAIDSM